MQLGKLLLHFFFFFFFFSFPEEALDCFVTVVTSAFPSQFGFCEFDKYSFKEFVFCILRIGFVCEGLMFFLHMKDFFFVYEVLMFFLHMKHCFFVYEALMFLHMKDCFVHEGNVFFVYEGL